MKKKTKLKRPDPPVIEFPEVRGSDLVSCRSFLPTSRDKDRCHICLQPRSAHKEPVHEKL